MVLSRRGREVYFLRPKPGGTGWRVLLALVAGVLSHADAGAAGSAAAALVGGLATERKAGHEATLPVPPWGRLEVATVCLEAPNEIIELTPMPDQRPVWRFPGASIDAVLRLLAEAGVAKELVAELARPEARVAENDGISLLPSVDQLLRVGAGARQVIYQALARSPANPGHQGPAFVFGDPESWLKGSDLTEEQASLVRRLLWRRGAAWAFSDVSALILRSRSAEEIRAARRLMHRKQSLRVRVALGTAANIGPFLAYWTAGRQNLAALPLLQAMIDGDPAEAVDLVAILPRLPRERVFTFPAVSDAVTGRLPDCNWSSLNFFAARPETYYLEAQPAYFEMMQNYEEVPRPSQLGDIVCFMSREGLVYHSCVHVAEDIVFTKNGESLLAPWLLLRLGDVAAVYGEDGARIVRTFRLKPRAG